MPQKFSQSILQICVSAAHRRSVVSHGNSLKIINCYAKLVIPCSNDSKKESAS